MYSFKMSNVEKCYFGQRFLIGIFDILGGYGDYNSAGWGNYGGDQSGESSGLPVVHCTKLVWLI